MVFVSICVFVLMHLLKLVEMHVCGGITIKKKLSKNEHSYNFFLSGDNICCHKIIISSAMKALRV